jgi:hypothetical protein
MASGLSGLTPWGDQQSIITKLEEIINKIPDLKLIVRLHPNLLSKHFYEQAHWQEFAKSLECRVIYPDEPFDTYQLINDALFVVTCGSTTGIEASMMHKPSILLGQALHESLGATINVRSETEFYSVASKIINKQLDISGFVEQARKYAFWNSHAGINFKFNKIQGDALSQDPVLEVVGIKLQYNSILKAGFKIYKLIINSKHKIHYCFVVRCKFMRRI